MTFDSTGKLVLYSKKLHGLTDEHKAKISESLNGHKHSDETKELMSSNRAKAWEKDPRRITDETKQRIIRLRLDDGKTPTEIGSILDMDRKMVSKILRQAGISSRKTT